MKLEIDLRETTGDSNVETDIRSVIRFHSLIGDSISDHAIDEGLREIAFASKPEATLSDVIRPMVSEFAIREAKLSLHEFLARFKKNCLAELIASSFAKNLVTIDLLKKEERWEEKNYDVLEQDEKNIQKDYIAVLLASIDYLKKVKMTSTATIHAFFKLKKQEYPLVEMAELFATTYKITSKNGEIEHGCLMDIVVAKIYEETSDIATAAYEENFNQDKRGFVMGFLMGGVIKYDKNERKMLFNSIEFTNLMKYLDNMKVKADINDINHNNLYDLLYDEHQFMSRHIEGVRVSKTQAEMRSNYAKQGVFLDSPDYPEYGGPVIFGEDFDVKAFHDKHIKPALYRYYSKKQRKVTDIRPIDLLPGLHDTNTMGRDKYTWYLLRYVKTLVETNRRDPSLFMLKARELLGITKAPHLDELTDEQVCQHFNYYFDMAESKFKDTMSDALYYRDDSEILDTCIYPEEILKCRSLPKLLEWFIRPNLFKTEYPAYSNVPKDQIAFACSAFVKDFLRVMEEMSKKKFIEANKDRDVLEQEMTETLKIETLETLDLPFRVLIELDEHDQPVDPPCYDIVIDSTHVGDFITDQNNSFAQKLLAFPTMAQVEYNGKKYHACPEETKRFKLVKMCIPLTSLETSKKLIASQKKVVVRALIYSGDNHYIHVKEALTRVITMDRGKTITDETRWLLSFPDTDSLRAFKEFMYNRNPANAIKAEDSEEKRMFSNKEANTRNGAASTKSFKEFEDFKIVGPVNMTEPLENGSLQNNAIGLETQSVMLRNLLLGNLSEYTISGHPRYRSQRAWPLVFSKYFPPDVFGDSMKEKELQGYDYAS